MHIPDGFLSPPVWLSLDAISLPAVAWLARRTRTKPAPLLGVMGAFILAAQMVNIPIGLGSSGHLMGASLLAVTLGPTSAMLVMTAVLILQALLFQDGGVLALGANIFNMALAGVALGYLPVRLWGRSAIPVFLGGALSVLTTATLALFQLNLSGLAITGRPLWISTAAFALTAALEGTITVAALRAIERLSPHTLHAEPRGASFPLRALACATLLLLCGIWLSSSSPDGLQSLTESIGLQGR